MSNKKNPLRKKWFIDPKVQTAIAVKLVLYWVCGVVFILLPLVATNALLTPEVGLLKHAKNAFAQHWVVFVTMTLMLPCAVFDVFKFSNRFVGPIYRIRQELKRHEETGEMKPIHFRENDYWTDVSEGMTRLANRITELETQLKAKQLG
jgi:hypothetical protein